MTARSAVSPPTDISAIASAVALIVPSVSDEWATVLSAYHQHEDILVSEIVAAPGAGNHLEILSVTVNCAAVPLGDAASFILAADGEGLDIYRFVDLGDSWSESAVSPGVPLYVCASNVNFGIGALAVGTTLVVSVQYRIVAD